MKKDTVKQGEKAEQIFATKCFIEYDYMVSQPNGTTDYDLIVDVNNSLQKVQVKSSSKGNGNINICKGTNGHSGLNKYPYPKNTVDFFAIYDMTKDDWYIIPRSATGDAMNIRLAYKRQCKYTCYKNNFGFKK